MTDIILRQERLFRRTVGVHFSDIQVKGQNGLDLVEHMGYAVSPPNSIGTGAKEFYIHKHQIDNNRVIKGARVFELIDAGDNWTYNHYLVFLTEETGALEIPKNVYHRSVSSVDGSLLLNHAIRDAEFDEDNEFTAVSSDDNEFLRSVLKLNRPVYINASEREIDCFLSTGNLVCG